MARFFIERPIFAWVVAILIMVAGGVAIIHLPVAQYPQIAPPTVTVSAVYPGASAKTLEEGVLSVIEREMNGTSGLDSIESTSEANGRGSISLIFTPETDIDLAQVDVQNRLNRALPRLPASVTEHGIQVEKSNSNFLLFISLFSDNPDVTNPILNDYVARNVLPEIQRTPGVGKARLFASERAMRIWIDPAKLKAYELGMDDVRRAISSQNIQVPGGTLGDSPAVDGQEITAMISLDGQFHSEEQFRSIILRGSVDGSTVRLGDVATLELGLEGYAYASRLNGRDAASIGVQLSPSGNALETSAAIIKKLDQLQDFFPTGVSYSIPFNSALNISASIEKVVHTLFEAVVLVFLVIFLFLQNIRYTFIPTIVVPVALLGTFAVLLSLGYSINVLTMFGMVLVIGIVVDDAIVVVENVERIMSEEGLPPLQATRKAMGQISGAIIGITIVLISVFVPLAFFPGTTGNIYRQFAVTMTSAIAFSAFLALSLTPALCATMLKPVTAGHHIEKGGFFGWFNRCLKASTHQYESSLARLIRRSALMLFVYALLVVVMAFVYNRLPTSFLPPEDQGFLIVNLELPAGASQQRTSKALEQVEQVILAQPEVDSMVGVLGFSFSGSGQNAGIAFVSLKEHAQRKGAEHSLDAVLGRVNGQLRKIRDGFIFALNPPSIPGLGSSSDFSFRLQDRADKGYDSLLAARNQLLLLASQSKLLTGVRPTGMEDAPQVMVNIDRDKANALGVDYASIASTLSATLGSSYINDFLNEGRLQKVIIQAQAASRMQPEDLLKLPIKNRNGELIPLSSFATSHWRIAPTQTTRFNGYPTVSIGGAGAPGYSSGETMAEMEGLAKQLPPGFGFEWAELSREEQRSGNQAMIVYFFSILTVFLCLAALYESWSIPFSVLLVIPLGVLGVVIAVLLRGYDNNVYFQIGLVTIIGLSAKNAILIIEFAKDLQAQGKNVIEAALAAAHLRFRPIIMTSMAFTLGVIPLFFASGASSASQRAIGTTVVGGIVVGTFLAVAFVPVFFVTVRSYFKGSRRQREHDLKLIQQHLEEANRE